MYNIVHFGQNKHLMLNSNILGINTSILPKKHYKNVFSEKLVNGVHACIENHPHVIHSPNAKEYLSVNINGTIVKKQKHLLQIPVRELQNDIILPIVEVVVLVQ